MIRISWSRCVIAAGLVLALFGCGSDEDSNEKLSPSTEIFPIVALDGYSVAAINGTTRIDLTSYIRGGEANLTDVSYTGTNDACSAPIKSGIGFDVTNKSGALCDYQFTVSNTQMSDSASMKVFTSAAVNPLLPPRSYAMVLNEADKTFDLPTLLESDWPAGYSLRIDSVEVEGDESNLGKVTALDNSITYTSPSLSGWNRIVYMLVNEDKLGEDMIGTIYVTVSESVNQPPTIKYPQYKYNTTAIKPIRFHADKRIDDQATITLIAENNEEFVKVLTPIKSLEIDMADGRWAGNIYLPNVSGLNNKIVTIRSSASFASVIHFCEDSLPLQGNLITLINQEGADVCGWKRVIFPNDSVDINLALFITEPDGQEWQLVSVQSFSASVTAKDPNSITNKMITFSAGTVGKHIISYVAADDFGGYSVGSIQVEVSIENEPTAWKSLTVDNNNYTAPLRYYEGVDLGFDATPVLDSTVNNTIAGYNINSAKSYCASLGTVPTVSQITALKNMHYTLATRTGGLNQWPAAKSYLVRNEENDEYLGYDITTGMATASTATGIYYATCIVNQSLSLTMTTRRMVANNELRTLAVVDKAPKKNVSVSAFGMTNGLTEADVNLNIEGSGNRVMITSQLIKTGDFQVKVTDTADANNSVSSPIITSRFDLNRSSLKISDSYIYVNELGVPSQYSTVTLRLRDSLGNAVVVNSSDVGISSISPGLIFADLLYDPVTEEYTQEVSGDTLGTFLIEAAVNGTRIANDAVVNVIKRFTLDAKHNDVNYAWGTPIPIVPNDSHNNVSVYWSGNGIAGKNTPYQLQYTSRVDPSNWTGDGSYGQTGQDIVGEEGGIITYDFEDVNFPNCPYGYVLKDKNGTSISKPTFILCPDSR